MNPGAVNSHPDINPFKRFGFYAVLMLLFISYSRIFDIYLTGFHIPGIVSALVTIAVFFSGAFLAAFSSRIGVLLLSFMAWLVVCIPTSEWRSGSLELVTQMIPIHIPMLLAVAGLVLTFRQVQQAMRTLALAALVLAISSLALGSSATGRLFLDQGKFSNPNDLAQALLLTLPFWFLITRNPMRAPFRVLIGMGCIGIILAALAKTGSRGGLIAFLITVFTIFWGAPLIGKLKITAAAALVVVVGALFLPGATVRRYVVLTKDASVEPEQAPFAGDDELEEIAASSSESRKLILKESIGLTLRNPIFGVGPGMFPLAAAADSAAQGKRTPWLQTHNTFTQVSSEAGIPALVFYAGSLLACWLGMLAIERRCRTFNHPHAADIGYAAFCLRLSLASYIMTAAFSSVAYQTFLPTLAGLSIALVRTANSELDRLSAAATAAVPMPGPAATVRRASVVRENPARQTAARLTRS
ncbi:MAG: O-antigen ligase family protein [Bryobacteraceae bacterium]